MKCHFTGLDLVFGLILCMVIFYKAMNAKRAPTFKHFKIAYRPIGHFKYLPCNPEMKFFITSTGLLPNFPANSGTVIFHVTSAASGKEAANKNHPSAGSLFSLCIPLCGDVTCFCTRLVPASPGLCVGSIASLILLGNNLISNLL